VVAVLEELASRPYVFVTRELPGNAVERLRSAAQVEVWTDKEPPPREELLSQAARADALLTLLTDRVDAALLDGAPKLRIVSNMAVGFDNIDVEAATARGVLVTNTPGVLTETTADFAFALLLATARRLVEGDRLAHSGGWPTWHPSFLLGQDVYGATLGIVGMGAIGRAVARRAHGFGMRILYADNQRRPELEAELDASFAPLETLLRESDFVSLHVPLTDRTHHLIGQPELSLMKASAILINTSRGPVVDQAALCEALRSRTILAAGLDVAEVEPVPAGDPLLGLDNLTLTPHIASASVATRAQMADMAVDAILAVLRGETPANLLNPQAAAR
jgi:glyoxylate reductase